MCLLASYKQKIWKKYFFCTLKLMKKEFRSVSQRYGSGNPDPDPHQNVKDPQHWTKEKVSFFILQKLFIIISLGSRLIVNRATTVSLTRARQIFSARFLFFETNSTVTKILPANRTDTFIFLFTFSNVLVISISTTFWRSTEGMKFLAKVSFKNVEPWSRIHIQ
jgi:hypothetical protein